METWNGVSNFYQIALATYAGPSNRKRLGRRRVRFATTQNYSCKAPHLLLFAGIFKLYLIRDRLLLKYSEDFEVRFEFETQFDSEMQREQRLRSGQLLTNNSGAPAQTIFI